MNPTTIDLLNWIGGFFDGEGSFSFSQGSPSVVLVNTDPQACFLVMNTMKTFGIDAKINERSKPGKSSKKKRWDVFINQAEESFKFCELMKPYIRGKSKQLELIQEYQNIRKSAQEFHRKMQFLNQSNNILIIDKSKFLEKLGFDIQEWKYEIYDTNNDKLNQTDFSNTDYIAGLFDAEGCVNINMRKNKSCNTDRFIPQIMFTNTNKVIIENFYSAMKNNQIGCHITSRIPTERNRIRWDLIVSGLSRTKKVCDLLVDKSRIKNKQIELMLAYLNERLLDPKSINTTGYNVKMAIQSSRQ